MRKPGVKAFVVYYKKLLLILRDNIPNIPYPNTWNLPGGGIEDGESEIEALNRELKEEISIVPKNIIFLGKQTFEDSSEVFRYLIILTKKEYQNVKLGNEGQKLDFFTVDEIKNLELAGYSKEYFVKYNSQIKELVEEHKIPTPGFLGFKN